MANSKDTELYIEQLKCYIESMELQIKDSDLDIKNLLQEIEIRKEGISLNERMKKLYAESIEIAKVRIRQVEKSEDMKPIVFLQLSKHHFLLSLQLL